MLGTLLYAFLDISFNTTLWIAKASYNGIYSGVTYLWGEDIDIDTERDKERVQEISNLTREYIELQKLQKEQNLQLQTLLEQNKELLTAVIHK